MPDPVTLTCMGTSVGKGVLGKVGEYLVDPILQQFNYMCCFDSNITELDTQLRKLEPTIHDVQLGVDEDLNNVKVIPSIVKDWLESANKVTTEVQGIIQDKAKVKEGCLYRWGPNFKLRYSLSKEAVKKTKDIVDLQACGLDYAKSSQNQAPTCMEPRPNRDFMYFETRRANMEEIFEALKQDEITLIGICGMGGIGKTKMVQEVRNRAIEEGLFDECALVPVAQLPDLEKVQKRIADYFGLEDLKKHDDATVRAHLLSKRLLREDKRTLLILDDVWDNFDLEDQGIPLEGARGKFKLLFTSRHQGIWSKVRNKKEIGLGVLSEEEAWQLFRKEAGEHLVDSLELQPIAKRIVNECGRLPLALAVIGSALAEKSTGRFTKDTWEDMCARLTCPSSTPADKRLFSSLELSYDYIEDEDAKRLFLLCCLFEEDASISIENLARYALGLSHYDGVKEIRKVRHRVFALAADLMRRHLLLDGEDVEHVKVHDVVRDMGISVATKSKDKRALVNHGAVSQWPNPVSREQYTAISVISKEIEELPGVWTYPNVEFLIVQCKELKKLPSNFLEGMVKLKVLELNSFNGILTLQSLRNLTTLSLERFCGVLDNASIIGDLLNLEILNFHGSSIEELPEEIGKLVKLRLLDLRGANRLTRIPPGVISRLVRLEELYFNSSIFWCREGEGMGEKGENVILRELDSLSHLTTLEIHISDQVVIPKVSVFENLKRHVIAIGDIGGRSLQVSQQKGCERVFQVMARFPNHGGINSLLENSDGVRLQGEGCNDLVRELQLRARDNGLQQMKLLEIRNCETPGCLANTRKNPVHPRTRAIFPILKELDLSYAYNLKEICCGFVPAGSFGELTSIEVDNCHRLENLFQVPLIEGCLTRLEQLNIGDCDKMAEVFRKDQSEEVHVATNNKLVLPKLKTLKLKNLLSLMGFCRGIDRIDLPQLKELHLDCIPQVNLLFHNNCNLSSDNEQNDDGFLSLFPPTVSLPNLEVLEVHKLANLERLGHGSLLVPKLLSLSVKDCDKLLCVFTSQFCQMPRGLQNLTVTDCPSLEVLVEWEEGLESNESNSETLFALKFVKLENLPKLNCISKRDFMSYSFIQTLEIRNCDSLRWVFEPNMTKKVPQLCELKISSCKMLSGIVAEENGLGESSMNEVLFPRLKILELQDLPKLVSFFPNANVNSTTLAKTTDHHRNPLQPQPLFNEKVAIPSLEELKVHGLMNVDLWCSKLPSSAFSKLKNLDVGQCPRLRNVFHSSTAGGRVNLWTLVISGCSTLEAVVGEEELCSLGCNICCLASVRTTDKTLFPRLQYLFLHRLPNLTRFCHFTHPFEMALLSRVDISDCPNMDAFSLGPMSAPNLSLLDTSWNGDLNNALPKKVSLPNLEILEVTNLANQERLVHGSLLVPKLYSLSVKDCDKLLCVFTSQFCPILQGLQKLTVTSCPSLEVLVEWEEGLESNKPDSTTLFALKFVYLENLPKLDSISKRDFMSYSFIHTLEIKECDSLRCVFEHNMTKIVPQLFELKISSCKMLLGIVAEENGLGESSVNEVQFPRLKILELRNLPKLVSFFPNANVNPTTMAKTTDQHRNPLQPQPLFNEKVAIPSLEELEVYGLMNVDLWCSELPSSSFSKLEKLKVRQCPNLRNVFHASTARGLANLLRLCISNCSTLEAVVGKEEQVGDFTSVRTKNPVHRPTPAIFPQLKLLELCDLPNLVSFFPNVNVNSTSVAKSPDHHRNPLQPQPLFNEKVAIPSLEELKVHGLMNVDLWCSELPSSSFSKLEKLNVIKCPSLRNVFHSSMAGGLVNLRRLFISNCSTLEAIVRKEEQVGGLTSVRTIDKTLFPQLRKLWLNSLPNLMRFCHFTHPLDMPLLIHMDILDCHKMASFSLGPVSALNLFLPGISWNGDLNNAIPVLKKEEEEEEDMEEDEKVEIDEEEEEDVDKDKDEELDMDVDEDVDGDEKDQEEKTFRFFRRGKGRRKEKDLCMDEDEDDEETLRRRKKQQGANDGDDTTVTVQKLVGVILMVLLCLWLFCLLG